MRVKFLLRRRPRFADSAAASGTRVPRRGAHRTSGRAFPLRWFASQLLAAGILVGSSAGAQAPDACTPRNAPQPAFQSSCQGSACTFTLTTSPSGIAQMDWDFGDGATSSGAATQIAHAYAGGGVYLVTLTATAMDGALGVAQGAVEIGPADLAADDYLAMDSGASMTIALQELLANDAPGVVFDHIDNKCQLSSGGSTCSYYPPGGAFSGIDTLEYWVHDSASPPNVDSAIVYITVNRVLVANPDQLVIPVDPLVPAPRPLTFTSAELLQNDSPGAVFVRAENPVHGALQLTNVEPSGIYQYTFTPDRCFVGFATFEYLVSWDGQEPFTHGFVTVDVQGAPTASFTVQCGHAPNPPRGCTVDTRSQDDGCQALRYFWNWGDGTPTYEVPPPYPWFDQTHVYEHSGRYTITHTVTNDRNQSSSFQLEVLPNTAPVAADDTAETERDIPVTVEVLANDSDPDGDILGMTDLSIPHPGVSVQTVQSPSGWALKITPPDSFVGTLSFTYRASDRWGATSTAAATLTLTVNQWSSVTDALGEQLFTPQNMPLRFAKARLLANDYDESDFPGDTLSIVGDMDTSILMGTLDCSSEPGYCTYTPPLNGAGFTLFRYTVEDGIGHRDTATVRIYVGVHGTAPILQDDYFTASRDTPKTFTVQEIVANDFDAEGDTLTVSMPNGLRDFGSIACTTPFYSCTYTPVSGFVGADRFLYWASDVMNPQSTAMINMLTLPPATPTFDAREDFRIVGVNQQTYFTNGFLAANDYDPEHDPITVLPWDTTGLMGSMDCDAGGCTYHPPLNYQGTTRFKYTATDGWGNTDAAIVKIRVGGTDSAPVANPDSFSTPKNTQLRFSVFELLRNDYDPENDPMSVTVYPQASKGTLSCGSPQYWCTYTPNANVTGADTLTYLVSGAAGTTSTITINILP